MIHKMGLYEASFNSMKSGRKTVEVRLNDEKRRKLNIGNIIEFVKVPGEDEKLTVEVTDLRKYKTFKEMYEDIPYKEFDAVGDSIEEMVNSTYKIYTPDQEKEWGTLAISVRRIIDNPHTRGR